MNSPFGELWVIETYTERSMIDVFWLLQIWQDFNGFQELFSIHFHFVLSYVYNFLLFKVNSYTKTTMFYVLHNLVTSIRLCSPLILLKLSWL